MPTIRGLGLMESRTLALEIGYQTSKRRDLPRFRALDQLKHLLLLVWSWLLVKKVTMGQPIDYVMMILPGGKVTRVWCMRCCVGSIRQALSWPLFRRLGPESDARIRLGYKWDIIYPCFNRRLLALSVKESSPSIFPPLQLTCWFTLGCGDSHGPPAGPREVGQCQLPEGSCPHQ
jgi:hypothetical protein